MTQFFKSLVFLAKFQWSITRKFFKRTKEGVRFYQDFGLIEAYMLTGTQVKKFNAEMRAEREAFELELSEQESKERDPSTPRFNLSGTRSDKLS